MKHCSLIALLVTLFLIQPANANASHSIVCESRGGYNFCRAPIRYRSDVRFVQKISKAGCNEGHSWGVTRGGVWVDRGCRAEFELARGGGLYSYKPGNDHGHHGSCNGHDHGDRPSHGYHKPKYCPAGARPGRCTQKQRRKGCKDFRTSSGVGCMTFG